MNWRRLAAAIYPAVITAVVAHAAVCYCNISRGPVVNCNTRLRRNTEICLNKERQESNILSNCM
ncbi:hypothetical protein PF005_g24288 [Phytophthora fragariae]|uniref:Secreted protein n=1 Tax=Phytophthora fragariae TaxID=53985 RepID=A0A6A4C1Y4_9STRA|nr:hypothetical protein PF003_g13814 [Phytophthora fragariae]KAE8927047.1 hypothetical protein PF009_g22774 [Phytophthora fragariae]KAE8979910.1 hypothetical protein PF011_g22653 [Phytophthora fragariae]KAE9077316.1 hypothetical protein PF007_g24288 [Phytophthora fragariae]KAE9108488.1 hypothetical protein PF006_g20868 [Phytophthora fragariae]